MTKHTELIKTTIEAIEEVSKKYDEFTVADVELEVACTVAPETQDKDINFSCKRFVREAERKNQILYIGNGWWKRATHCLEKI